MDLIFDPKELNRLNKGIKSQEFISEEELFTDDFISTCTRYKHLYELVEAFLTVKLPYVFNRLFEGDRTLNHILDFFEEAEIWDEFIAYNTIFEGWDSFYRAAVELYNTKTDCYSIVHKFKGLKNKPINFPCGFTHKHEFNPAEVIQYDDYY